jgi:hypothetical protein
MPHTNIVSNAWTQQRPISVFGSTGDQILKLIPAARIFIKAPDATVNTPYQQYAGYSFKTNGVAPTGWTDLGSIDKPAKLTYTKTTKSVTTGIDTVERAIYVDKKTAMVEFNLLQSDDYVLSALGFSGSAMTAGSSMNFLMGGEDIVTRALLVVYQNKLDGKEFHIYHPAANLNVTWDMSSADELTLKATAELLAFTPTGATVDALYAMNIFA